MKLKFIAVIGTFLLSAQAYAGGPLVLKTEKDKLNYGIGVNVVRNFQQEPRGRDRGM